MPLSPVLAVAVAVRLSSPGPVLFRQLRTGQDGRPIGILKFRSLGVAPVVDLTDAGAPDDRD